MVSSSTEIHGDIDGQPVRLFTLRNTHGMQVQISELGAHLVRITIPDQTGNPCPLTLGHHTFEGWKNNRACLGSTCGRFGNRIAHGKFSLDGEQFTLTTNNKPGGIPCHLHGGLSGFHTKLWQGRLVEEEKRTGVRLSFTSPDGDEGYPGNLDIAVTYWLNEDNALTWLAKATADKPTPINIINHSYWNLSGDLKTDVSDHQIQIHADYFLPISSSMIPTGEIRPVTGTPMDLTQPKFIGNGINSDYESIQTATGYDHCWVLRDHYEDKPGVHTAAIVHHPGSGRTLEILTNQPGVQFYTGNFLGDDFPRRSGLCLETGGFPDAPNHPNFPSSILRPGETYRHELIFRMS